MLELSEPFAKKEKKQPTQQMSESSEGFRKTWISPLGMDEWSVVSSNPISLQRLVQNIAILQGLLQAGPASAASKQLWIG